MRRFYHSPSGYFQSFFGFLLSVQRQVWRSIFAPLHGIFFEDFNPQRGVVQGGM